VEVVLIDLRDIVVDPEQPRRHHSEESLKGLADSIRQHGMLNPITVAPRNSADKHRIVTGERRWRAAELAGLSTLPCIIKQVDPDERLTEQLIENLQREDLQPLEKARAIQHVKEGIGATNREVAKRLGLSERTIGYLLDLMALPEEIGEAVISSPNRPADGQVTEKHARFLKQLNDDPDLQSAVVERIKGERLTGDETGNLVRALKRRPDRSGEIMASPADHLADFYQDEPDMEAPFEDEEPDQPLSNPFARRIIDFLGTLSGFDAGRLSHPELRQVEDALTSLKLTADGLLQACRQRLGDRS
jgi:ParB family chromosome partitioning protein